MALAYWKEAGSIPILLSDSDRFVGNIILEFGVE
jgi:hypothetical protein